MSTNQTPKARVLATCPGAVSERVTHDLGTFTRILNNGEVIGQGSTPNKAWQVAAAYVERQTWREAMTVKPDVTEHTSEAKQAPVTPPQRPVMVPRKVKQARRNKNRIARASRKRNRAA